MGRGPRSAGVRHGFRCRRRRPASRELAETPSGARAAHLRSPAMANRTLVMELVGDPDSGAAIVRSRSLPVLTGTGSTDYACGACQAVLAASLKLGEIDGAMIQCPACGRVNRPK